MDTDLTLCQTCAVETDPALTSVTCAICDDERQWVPASGQAWTTLAELRAAGTTIDIAEVEPDLFAVTTSTKVGIGQTAWLVRTPHGLVMWDCVGYLDDAAVTAVREVGELRVIATSHPHMFGAQTAWGEAFGATVWTNADDAHWLRREAGDVRRWSGEQELLPGVVAHQLGGHFKGSGVAVWRAGAEGRGVVLSSDTIMTNPDLRTVSFLRSYPNKIPLSPAVTRRIAAAGAALGCDRLYNNFGMAIARDAVRVIRDSGERQARWSEGAFDADC